MNSKLRGLPWPFLLCMTVGSPSLAAAAHSSSDASETKISAGPAPAESPRYLHDERQTTQGSMTVGGRTLAFQAEAGVLVVHVRDPMDDDPPLPKDERTGPP